MNFVVVASDGSSIKKPKVGSTDSWWCSGAFVAKVLNEDGISVETFSNGIELDNSTNNIGELTGFEMAIDSVMVLAETHKILFLLDSEYTLKSTTVWIKDWMKNIKNGVPCTSSGTPAKNYEQILRIHNKLKKIKHKKVLKVRSHVIESDYKRRYHEFCYGNKFEVTYEMWLFMNSLNNECDELVYQYADNLRNDIPNK